VTDTDRIRYGITEALREQRSIDQATARAIATQLHGGQVSPLYALASSGALVDGLRDELDTWRRDDLPVEVEPWLDALDEYLDVRADQPEAIEGWSQLWPDDPPRPDAELDSDDEASERQALAERNSAAGLTALGQVAIEQPDEPDDFSWADAATWSPTPSTLDDLDQPSRTPEELEALFGEQPDDELGSVDDLGWCGLIRHEDQPGGLILRRDEQGFRQVGQASTNEALDALWHILQLEYERYYEERDAYERATAEAGETPSGHSPRVWIGSLADYNDGRLCGEWMDATLEPDELHAAVRFMLRNSETPGAEEWSIFDHDGFGEYEVSEWSSFMTVSLVAQGIAEHGPVYAAWVNYVGDTSGDLLEPERFRDHYLGEWDSLTDYVEDVLAETEVNDALDNALQMLSEDVRRYVKLDVEGLAEEWEQGLYVVERGDGGVWVFDARA
jgi:antirestriction protein